MIKLLNWRNITLEEFICHLKSNFICHLKFQSFEGKAQPKFIRYKLQEMMHRYSASRAEKEFTFTNKKDVFP